MKKTVRLSYIGALLLVGALASCSDDDQYTFSGDATNRVFINTGVHTLEETNQFGFTVLHTPIGSLGAVSVSFPVTSTVEVGSDITVNLTEDNALATAFNERNGTNYTVLPVGYASVSTLTPTIAAGAVSSAPVTVSIPESRYADLQDPAYVMALRISGADHAAVSSALNTVYIVIRTRTTENLRENPVEKDTTGSRIRNRAAWTATLDVPFTNGALSTIFDGATNTHFRVTPPQVSNLLVDLGMTYENITDIRLHSQSATYAFRSITVWTSNDGIVWASEGTAAISATTAYQFMKFYSAVSARYIKLEIKGWRSAASIRLSEFDIYAIQS